MKKPLLIAIGIQVAIMVSVLVPPLLTVFTGQQVYLETQRVDPRALFRGDYVILDYPIGNEVDFAMAKQAYELGAPLYFVVTTDRPAELVTVNLRKPELQPGQACITGRASENMSWLSSIDDNWGESIVRFPQISQYFVPEGTGLELERDLNSMVAELRVTNGCNAVVTGLELL